MDTKSDIDNKKIQLTYDAAKDKYYLDIFAYRQSNTETFYGEYALEEYLRNDLCFDSEQINKLYSEMHEVVYN